MSIARVIVQTQKVGVDVQFETTRVVQLGLTGPQGPAANVHTHTQAAPSASWTINHNLGFKPDIALIDVGGNEVEGAILHTSSNQAVASFAIAIAGIARCS